jgi:hypothetical protein
MHPQPFIAPGMMTTSAANPIVNPYSAIHFLQTQQIQSEYHANTMAAAQAARAYNAGLTQQAMHPAFMNFAWPR